ncbi:MAG TPA: CHAT domain-containing protein, partial [Archangium sp.]|nr:CHAT domain-containing protein [Archangium sp.]
MTIELGRLERANEPYAFDGKPQKYFAQGAGQLGVAELPWDEVEKLHPEFQRATPTFAAQRKMGELLRRFLKSVLLELDGWAFYEKALLDAEEKKTSVRLRFRFRAGELFSLPWALTMLSKNRNLGSIKPHPLQFEWAHDTRVPLASPGLARVLFAWSDAEEGVSEDLHRDAIQKACPGFNPEQDELAPLSLDSLRDKLDKARQEGRPFRILHILCHGGPTPGGTFGLVWTDPHRPGRPARVDGVSICNVLGPFQGDLQAIVLSACHGSNPGQVGSMFGGVAHDLHRLGIPAVIASQMPLTLSGSIQMTGALYDALCQKKLPIDEAFQKAHEALSPSSLDWASLQFFAPSPHAETRSGGRRIVFSPAEPLPEIPEELVVSYEVNFNVPPAAIIKALEGRTEVDPDIVVLQPLGKVEDALPSTSREWRRALEQADQFVDALGTQVSMVHLFGRAPLPLMFHLGWRLSRWKLRVYQEERGRTGRWTCGYDSMQEHSPEEKFFRAEAWPDSAACRAAGGRLAMTIEVNLSIHPEELAKWLGTENPPALVRLVAARGTSHTVLRGPMDTARAVDEFRAYLDSIHAEWPDVHEV